MTDNDFKKLKKFSKVYLRICLDLKNDFDKDLYEFYRRSLQNLLTTSLCNTKAYHSGMITEAALEDGSRTKEHAYGMTKLAEDLLAIENPTIESIEFEILSWKSKWHYSTRKENMILKNNGQNYDDPRISKLVEYTK